MTDAAVPSDHPLRKLFHDAVEDAFRRFRDLYSPEVAEHIEDHVLSDFVHVDRVYRLRDLAGRRVDDLQEMLDIAGESEGIERKLEVDRYIGDFVVFMGGFFPDVLRRQHWSSGTAPRVARVGKLLVNFQSPLDYYVAEGRNAYSRAAKTAKLFDPDSGRTLRQLSAHIEGYLELVRTVKEILEEEPPVKEIDGIVHSDD